MHQSDSDGANAMQLTTEGHIMTKPNQPATDTLLTDIAQRHFHRLKTLETLNRDALDFHDVAGWAIRSALVEAHAAGFAAATK